MATIRGTLKIHPTDAVLLPQNVLLLMTGFPDPQQAANAAHDFIVNVKGIPDQTLVDVDGVPTTIGEQPAIVMSDINPAPAPATQAPEPSKVQGSKP
ncbi:MAG TPA: hypothetical protein VMB85_07815 [Bryobacteraceae bacterium]|nr:hypothetical protein [Bryobacteraceae bacterium]